MQLLDIPKIGVKRINAIKESWQGHKNIKDLMIFLSDCGISTSIAHKIYKVYGEESIAKLKENPYGIVDDVYGIGFKTADIIAEKLGQDKNGYNRCRAGIFYILSSLAGEGQCYASFEDLVRQGAKLLDIPEHIIAMTFSHLKNINELICENESKIIYLPPFYHSEVGIAKRICEIAHFKNKIIEDLDLEKIIKSVQDKNRIIYDSIQISAIKTAILSKFSVITGGPGTGKTTITKAIIDIFKSMDKKVILAAPTGRAARRLAEMSKVEAKTIHRLLEADHSGNFSKNSENKLSGNVIIIDESSMLDTILMYNLLKAIPNEMIVIMIGDADQLPSVNAGNVLNDIINSEVLPVTKLNRIYRQAEFSKIITNSHKINVGQMPDLKVKNNSDFFFISENDPENIVSIIKELCSQRLPNHYKVNKISDIQVLSPMKRGLLGTENLNIELQNALNDSKLFIKRGANKYKLADKVMQIKNNYDKDIFNGDIGIISDVNLDDNSITVDFDGNFIEYGYQELEELVLSYSVTIHKSQGAEFPIVVMPIHFQNRTMLQRNLLYTGITRAKKIVVLVGDKNALKYAVQNSISNERKTLLKEKLIGQLDNKTFF